MKAYGLWNTKAQRWIRDAGGVLILVWYSVNAAEAQRQVEANPFNEVAEIGDDGLPVEPET